MEVRTSTPTCPWRLRVLPALQAPWEQETVLIKTPCVGPPAPCFKTKGASWRLALLAPKVRLRRKLPTFCPEGDRLTPDLRPLRRGSHRCTPTTPSGLTHSQFRLCLQHQFNKEASLTLAYRAYAAAGAARPALLLLALLSETGDQESPSVWGRKLKIGTEHSKPQ